VFYEGGEVAGLVSIALGEDGCEEFGEVGFGGVGRTGEEAVNGDLVGFYVVGESCFGGCFAGIHCCC
jgi:hypothetical protein